MFKTNHSRKSSVSIKTFIKEFGEDFSEHVKDRLMDLEDRCFLTRKEIVYRFDLKHVEHLKYEIVSDEAESATSCSKEYAYGQFIVLDGVLCFSDKCLENNEIMQSPKVSSIYNALDNEKIIVNEESNLKRLDDDNIDFVVDSILSSCPEVSQSYLDILQGMISRSNNK